ncbi:MAG TPA: anthranilate phosphoribosyltransferase [Methanobacteriaceae archaeon]|nr:anthranilate phosphoribosyltransferase [Methanobacteriaceae archaeon]
MIAECLGKIVEKCDLTQEEAYYSMMDMLEGRASEIQVAAVLSSLRVKGETVDELTGFARAMRHLSINVTPKTDKILVDTCGTGGDILKTFNVSTAAAIIAASCGVAVAKHGNRSITSKCGGADILEALGVNIECGPGGVEKCLDTVGMGFMFAPFFHPALGRLMPIRRELNIPTVFNLLGPLSSPAEAQIQLLGVYDPSKVVIMARVLQNLGVKKAMVVHGFDEKDRPAMDEISTLGKTLVAFVNGPKLSVEELHPEDLGVKMANREDIAAPDSLEDNLKIIKNVLSGKTDSQSSKSRLDLCLVNAGAILFLTGKTSSISKGVELARTSVMSGNPLTKLQDLVQVSQNHCNNNQ